METVEEFFMRFERMSGGDDVAGLVAQYAPQFLVGSAQGTQILSQPVLAQVIPKRKQILASFGCGSSVLQSVVETKLDEKFSSVRTAWKWNAAPPAAAPFDVAVTSTYIVERVNGRLQIVAYFAHGDIVTELQRRSGLK